MGLKNQLDDFQSGVLEASNVLCGTVSASEHADYILPLLFFKYLSDLRQEKVKQESPDDARRTSLESRLDRIFINMDQRTSDYYSLLEKRRTLGLGARLNSALASIEDACRDDLGDVFGVTDFDSSRLGSAAQRSNMLSELLEKIANISFDNLSHGDDLYASGDFFTIAVETLASPRKNEVRIAPIEVSRLIAKLLSPCPSDYLYDPSCGSGSLLIACAIEGAPPPNQHPRIFGLERSGTMWAYARMSAFVHGENGSQIQLGSPLQGTRSERQRYFDVAVSLPPWGEKEIPFSPLTAEVCQEFLPRPTATVSSEYASILYMLSVLKREGGRMALLVPTGALAKGGPEKFMRQRLAEENYLEAVIALPGKLIPGTAAPVSILLLKHGRTTENVLFIHAADPTRSTRGQNRISGADVNKILGAYDMLVDIDGYSSIVSFQEIASRDFNWQPSEYTNSRATEIEFDLENIQYRRRLLKQRLDELDDQIDRRLAEMRLFH